MHTYMDIHRWLSGKESTGNAGDTGLILLSRRSPGEWQPTAIFLPGKSHEQRRLVNCSLWDCKQSDMT